MMNWQSRESFMRAEHPDAPDVWVEIDMQWAWKDSGGNVKTFADLTAASTAANEFLNETFSAQLTSNEKANDRPSAAPGNN